MIVKVCGITNAEDALASVEAGASALGFNFYPKSPRYVRPEVARAIADRVSVLRVGVFVNEKPDQVVRVMNAAGMDVAQIYLSPLPAGVRTWRARNVDATFDAAELRDTTPEAFVLDAPAPSGIHGGTGHTFDWSRIPAVDRRIVLAGGLDASNVAVAISISKPWGVDACSRLESKPGRKDHRRVREFIEAAMAVTV
jgi:phosphoribosylanthranilate isomerase